MTLRIGFTSGIWTSSERVRDLRDLVLAAERLGFDSVWAGEAYGNDALTPLAWAAAQTTRVRLGTSVLQMPTRSPAAVAMAAASLDLLSGGRFELGLGTSGPQVAEGLHGQRFERPLALTRDYVAIVRTALRREVVEHRGEVLTVPLPGGPGKALRLMISPTQRRIPIHLAANGPRSMELAGEIADGIIPTMLTPDGVRRAWGRVRHGADRIGRSLDDFAITVTMKLVIDPDPEAARDRARPYLARLVGGMGSREQNFYNDAVTRAGFGDEAHEIRARYLGGDRAGAVAAVTDDVVRAFCLAGSPTEVAHRIAEYRAAGATRLIVASLADGLEREMEQLEMVAELAGLDAATE
ncbi:MULTISPECIES: LLM class F420-dependent oxidoreductase [Polymorphospora]|uniref:LLM class F420-dependent oxidoreductase n=1 Tax=Polymorphospora lycopeni TaxID=3140240 RepID=A0ABV5CRZ1_9ACTN